MNFDDFDGVWQELDGISEISFELLLPDKNIKKENEEVVEAPQTSFMAMEENLMRQNLVTLAMKENITIRQNKEDDVNLLIKSEESEITKSFKMNLPRMTEDDIRFFQLLAHNQNLNINNQNSITVENGDSKETLSNLKFSKSLMNLIEYSLKSQKPIRIDFAQNAAVILRISKEGRVSAEFIAADKAMERLIKTNIPQLKNKLDSSGIKYKKIYYTDEEE